MDRQELTIQEAAELSGYSARHIRRLVQQTKIQGRRIGARVYLVNTESLQSYVARMEALGEEKHAPA